MTRIRGMPQKRSEKPSVRPKILEFDVDYGAQTRFQVGFSRQGGFDRFPHCVIGLMVKSHHQRFFGIEIVVSCADRHAGSRGDLAHAGFVESAIAKKIQGRRQNAIPRFPSLGRAAGRLSRWFEGWFHNILEREYCGVRPPVPPRLATSAIWIRGAGWRSES